MVKPEMLPEENQVYEEDDYEDSDVFNVPGSSEMGWDHDASNKGIDCLLSAIFQFSFIQSVCIGCSSWLDYNSVTNCLSLQV